MRQLSVRVVFLGMIGVMLFGLSSTARAQASPDDSKFAVDFAIGWDNTISGNINSSAIGRLNNTAVVITKNQYDAAYGQGLHLRFGGGYMVREDLEARVNFTFQSADADLVRMGDYGVSNLYGQYSDYQSLTLDLGMRKYHRLSPAVRLYGEGLLGIGFVDKTDVELVAPAVNLYQDANDFYDQTTAFAFNGNGGVMFQFAGRSSIFLQAGLRWTSGMSEVDDFAGTGLDEINDDSSRWTIPFLAGIRFQF